MNLEKFKKLLEENPNQKMHWMLPDKSFIAAHYHITEIGLLKKEFIDCGGTKRSTSSCLLQIWVANDFDHCLTTTKLLEIIEVAKDLVSEDLKIEMEYETDVISQYPIYSCEKTPSGLLFYLDSKHTACLAPEKCGVEGCCP